MMDRMNRLLSEMREEVRREVTLDLLARMRATLDEWEEDLGMQALNNRPSPDTRRNPTTACSETSGTRRRDQGLSERILRFLKEEGRAWPAGWISEQVAAKSKNSANVALANLERAGKLRCDRSQRPHLWSLPDGNSRAD
jgi:hypothetical protein